MGHEFPLRQTAANWEFTNEASLEAFVILYLKQLLNLSVVKQQYYINNQICDLLAVNERGQLTILELKNTEDRYVVQQLTRYYDALLSVKPFQDLIDYTLPIRLMAIAPSFHRDSEIDRKYTSLDIELVQFVIIEREGELDFQLQLVAAPSSAIIGNSKIPYALPGASPHPIPEPPTALLRLLAKGSDQDRQQVLKLREILLSFDARMQELVEGQSIHYGKGKSKLCAELCFDSQRNSLALFLWLPHVVKGCKTRSIVARMRIWTDWAIVTDLGHVPKGLGHKVSFAEWHQGQLRPLNKILPKHSENRQRYFTDVTYREGFVERNRWLCQNPHYRSGLAMPFETYLKCNEKPEQSALLNDVVQLALTTWLARA